MRHSSFVVAAAIVCALATMLWCGTPSARAQAPAGGADEPKQYLPLVFGISQAHSDRGECDGIDGCVSLTSAEEYAFADQDETIDQAEIVQFACPEEHPYFWDWGFDTDAGLTASLEQVSVPKEDERFQRVTFQVVRTELAQSPLKYRLYVACADQAQTADTLAAQVDSTVAPQAAEEISVEPKRGVVALQSMLGNQYSPIGLAVWKALTASDVYPKSASTAAGSVNAYATGKYLGTTYDYGNTNAFDAGWLLQTPRDAWGITGKEYQFSVTDPCLGSDPATCDSEFQRQICTLALPDTCAAVGGVCTAVDATVTKPGDAPRTLCLRNQDVLWNEIYKVIVSGEKRVDITTLNQSASAPDGHFLLAIRNAITYLANTGRTMTVRLLVGSNVYYLNLDTKALLTKIATDASKVPGNHVSVFVGKIQTNYIMALNHSKIVVADGKLALIGGQNQFEDDYLAINPAYDISVRVRGPAAYTSQVFATRLWDYVCGWNGWSLLNHSNSYIPGTGSPWGSKCDKQLGVERTPGPGDKVVFPVGRLGPGITSIDPIWGETANQSEVGILALLKSATSTIRLSQQDIAFGIGGFWSAFKDVPIPWITYNIPYMNALADALLNGKDVYIVFSNVDSLTGRTKQGSYYNGFTPEKIAQDIKWYVERRDHAPTGDELNALLCQHLHLTTFRFGRSDTWEDGTPPGLHTKLVIADDQAFYIGSHNFYLIDLQEFGLIIDDAALTKQYLDEHWNNLWEQSKRVAVSGSELPGAQCVFFKH